MRQLVITKQITQRSEASINRYFLEINRYPMITPEEEVELSVRIRNGDTDALEKLVLANLRFVISVAKQYQGQGLSFSDLINEGNLGLVKAASKFDETRGFKFISYAVWWIRQSIIQAISNQTRIVRLPVNRLSSINRITRAIPHLEQEYEREPTDDEIALYLDLTHDEVKLANNIKRRQISLDKPLSQEGDNDFSLYDLLHSGDLPMPDTNLIHESVLTNVNRALNKLPRREAEILTMSFGLSSSPVYSLFDIAEEFNLTSERVRQIKSRALRRLKVLLKGNNTFIVEDDR
ncbi:MAG: RNA polymerase sigma factor RpoD/SigA [Bacteroidales bacterium]|nr:RNA polymerase sigma factor RpoD/SigA [Bacteroidales bacterium]